MNNNNEDTNLLEKQLIRAGAFNPDDLTFNQAGELSQRQKRWLTVEVASWMVQVGIDLILIVCAWFAYYFQYPHNTQMFFIGGLFWSIVLGTGIFSCFQHARPVWADMKNNEVKSVAGIISKRYAIGSSRNGKGIVFWGLNIRNQLFDTTQFTYNSIVDHQSYRIFYMPALHRVVNIEPLADSHEKKQSTLAALQQRMKENED